MRRFGDYCLRPVTRDGIGGCYVAAVSNGDNSMRNVSWSLGTRLVVPVKVLIGKLLARAMRWGIREDGSNVVMI